MAKDSKGHGSDADDRAYRREQQSTYKAGRAAQAKENQAIMGSGKSAENMRDVVRAKIAEGQKAAAAKKPADYHAVAGKVRAGSPTVKGK